MNSVVDRFNLLYLGDSVLERIDLQLLRSECTLTFHAGRVLVAQGASIFEPAESYAPARLVLSGVRRIQFAEGSYGLNGTVVDFGAEADVPPGNVAFSFHLAGGYDASNHVVRLEISARDFWFGAKLPDNSE